MHRPVMYGSSFLPEVVFSNLPIIIIRVLQPTDSLTVHVTADKLLDSFYEIIISGGFMCDIRLFKIAFTQFEWNEN